LNVDPRGPRLGAWVTTGVLAVVLLAQNGWLAAAFLNAAFGFCLGCEVYLLIRRLTTGVRRSDASTTPEGVFT